MAQEIEERLVIQANEVERVADPLERGSVLALAPQ
jgi:hypothetical protein